MSTAPLNYKDGHRPTPPDPLFPKSRWAEIGLALGLTRRQLQIAELICSGLTYECIALELGISINTVRMHVRSLFDRLGVSDRVQMVVVLVQCERRLN